MGLTSFIVLLFSLSFHEASHAWMARRLGDHTAEHEGRISLNPMVHIDPLGTIVIPLTQIFSVLLTGRTVPLLGWAKPTPYNPNNFTRNVTMARGHILVAAAGPVSNLILALAFTAALFVAVRVGGAAVSAAPVELLTRGIQMNVGLGIFNLFPLPPLDGSKVASFGLPRSLGEVYDRVFEPIGQILLLLLVATGILGLLLTPITSVFIRLLYSLIL